MARSTTQSVWRSGGGDQTRTATNGSMGMYATFYIANAAATGNVTCNSTLPNPVVLPANAVVSAIVVNSTGTGNVDLGFTPLNNVGPGQNTTLGTAVPTGFLANASASTKASYAIGNATAGAYVGQIANATNLVVVTSEANSSATGSVAGYIHYFVSDDGQQNV